MKKRHYIVYITINESIIAKNIIRMLYKNIWRIHDLSNIIILDFEYYREAVNSVLFIDRWTDRSREYKDEALLI